MRKSILLFFAVFFALHTLSSEEILGSPLFLARHSGKTYDPNRDLSLDQIQALITAARWAPSSHNDQPWNFILCHRTHTPEAWEKAFRAFKPRQQAWTQNAPLFAITITRTTLSKTGKVNSYAEYDTGAAAFSIALQAVNLGLMAHQVGGFDKEIISKEFHLPENCKPMTIIVIGYEGSDSSSPLYLRDRKSISENFFWGKWGLDMEKTLLKEHL